MKRKLSILLTVLLLLGIVLPMQVEAKVNYVPNKVSCSETASNLKLAERKLWQDHVLWTRNFIVSDLSELDDKAKVLERLLKNQDELGDLIKPYYGEEKGAMFSKLLKEHIEIAGQVIETAKSDNKEDLEKYTKLWYANADSIIDFLSGINPAWSKTDLKALFYKHLQLITEEVVASLTKDWAAEIAAYDKGEDHILMLSDTIAEGIIKQFPKKF